MHGMHEVVGSIPIGSTGQRQLLKRLPFSLRLFNGFSLVDLANVRQISRLSPSHIRRKLAVEMDDSLK